MIRYITLILLLSLIVTRGISTHKVDRNASIAAQQFDTRLHLNQEQKPETTIKPNQFLTPSAVEELNLSKQPLTPEGYDLVKLLQKNLVSEFSIDTLTTKYLKKESTSVGNIMEGKIILLNGYGLQEVGFPVNWFHTPKGDLQWPTHLSRHYWLVPLAHAWQTTKDPKYSGKIIEVLTDWIEKNPIGNTNLTWGAEDNMVDYKGDVKEGFFHSYVDGPWTSLSAHARVDYWSYLLAMIHDSPQMTNKNLSIILNSLAHDHRKLMLAHPRHMNQFIGIATSLTYLSSYYPYLQGAKEAGEIGAQRVEFFAKSEIYPDGSMAECSPNYSKASIVRVFEVVQEDKKMGGSLYKTLMPRIENGLRYFFYSSDPSLCSPRIAKGSGSIFPKLKEIYEATDDPNLRYLATHGSEGIKPEFLSNAYNWAGHIIFRSDWSKDATWMFFEPGPRGSGHSDVATLNIQLQSKGEWLLTDPGYFTYSRAGEEGEMSEFLHSSAAHNVAQVDGKNQIPFEFGKSRAYNTKPGNYNWSDDGEIAKAEGIYDYGFGNNGELKVTHKREITYLRKKNKFIIKDIFSGENEHNIKLHWQLAPEATFIKNKQGFLVENGAAKAQFNLNCLQPFEVASVKGRKVPLLGWYSETYGELNPSTTVTVTTNGKLPITFTTEIILK